MKNRSVTFRFILLLLACLAVLPEMRAVVPTPDGCYPGYSTAEGCNALSLLTTGLGNTGLGWYSLYSNGTGSFNTGVGGGALALNNADSNTAVGAAALLLNTNGNANVAIGTDALALNDTGSTNTAVGAFALFSHTEGDSNTAVGDSALYGAMFGSGNTAIGSAALYSGGGGQNTAIGYQALFSSQGPDNTALGYQALLSNTSGSSNTAIGRDALQSNTTGSNNIAVGWQAGSNHVTGNYNIYIGTSSLADESNTIRISQQGIQNKTYIAGISGEDQGGTSSAVYINTSGRLGTQPPPSSCRFKNNIKPMDHSSEAILSLKPVTFQYKSDNTNTPQFGLIAEEVAAADPDLVVRDKGGRPYTVRYDQVNAMLLNEFLKEHAKVQDMEQRMTALSARLDEQTAQIHKMTAHTSGEYAGD